MPLARKELLDYAERHSSKEDACDVLEADCKIIIYLLDNCKITVPENNRFFVNVNCKGILNQIAWKRAVIYDEELKKISFRTDATHWHLPVHLISVTQQPNGKGLFLWAYMELEQN